MSNDGSGSSEFPFDAAGLAKEVEKQTKTANKALKDLGGYESTIRAVIAARKRIEGEILRDAAQRAGAGMPRLGSRSTGARSDWMPSGTSTDISHMGESTSIRGMGASSSIRGIGATSPWQALPTGASSDISMVGGSSPWQAMPTGAHSDISKVGMSSPWLGPTGARSSLYMMGERTDIRNMGASSPWLMPTGAHSDISGMGATSDISMIGRSSLLSNSPKAYKARMAAQARAGAATEVSPYETQQVRYLEPLNVGGSRDPSAGGPGSPSPTGPGVVGRFVKGLETAVEGISAFKLALGTAAAAAVVSTIKGSVEGYSNRGSQASQQSGGLVLQVDRAARMLGMDPRMLMKSVIGSGDMAGASSFLDTVIATRAKGFTVDPRNIQAGFQAIGNNAGADTVKGWYEQRWFGKIRQAAEQEAGSPAQSELRRRRRAESALINTQIDMSAFQKDVGAYAETGDYLISQDNPVLSNIPIAGWLQRKGAAYGYGAGRGEAGVPVTHERGTGPRAQTPVRQPNYDVQSGGRIQVDATIIGDQSRRPSPRTGNGGH